MYFAYLDLPHVPDNLVISIDQLASRRDFFPGNLSLHYKQYELLNEELTDVISKIFPFRIKATYQLITEGFHIHRDKGRTEAFNYLINTGNATTRIYAEDRKTVLVEKNIELFRWHYLNVSKFHEVKNISNKRVSISVTPLVKDSLDMLSNFIVY